MTIINTRWDDGRRQTNNRNNRNRVLTETDEQTACYGRNVNGPAATRQLLLRDVLAAI